MDKETAEAVLSAMGPNPKLVDGPLDPDVPIACLRVADGLPSVPAIQRTCMECGDPVWVSVKIAAQGTPDQPCICITCALPHLQDAEVMVHAVTRQEVRDYVAQTQDPRGAGDARRGADGNPQEDRRLD